MKNLTKPLLLFDLFGVIANHQSESSKQELIKLSKIDADSFWKAYWTLRPDYDNGNKNSYEYWSDVAAALQLHYNNTEIEELTMTDIESWNSVDTAAVDLVGQLKNEGYSLALLSNIPEDLAKHYEHQQPWLELFELRGFSCRIGHAKPQAEAYIWCAQKLGRSPQEILFIDDREDNVNAAKKIGMHAYQFTSVPDLKRYLLNHME